MQKVIVKREALLAKLKENRYNHRGIFEEAQMAFRQRMIEELDKALDDAKHGRSFRRFIDLPEPEDHTKDYDRVITMVEMSVSENVELTQQEFAIYVMDDWGWKGAWTNNTVSYTQ